MKRNLTVVRIGSYRIEITLQDVAIFKATLTIGILAVHFLPNQYAIPVTIATNLLWVWRG